MLKVLITLIAFSNWNLTSQARLDSRWVLSVDTDLFFYRNIQLGNHEYIYPCVKLYTICVVYLIIFNKYSIYHLTRSLRVKENETKISFHRCLIEMKQDDCGRLFKGRYSGKCVMYPQKNCHETYSVLLIYSSSSAYCSFQEMMKHPTKTNSTGSSFRG